MAWDGGRIELEIPLGDAATGDLVRLLRGSRFAEVFLASGRVSEIDCIILDVRMPGMSGLDLHLALTRMNHRAPVI